jgi:predicted O-methyltransferase YrrM
MPTESVIRSLDKAEVQEWYRNKEFAYDWTSGNFPVWTKLLAPLADQPVRVLEIGSYEGRSAIFFLRFLRRCSLVCIDVWDSSVLEPELVKQMPEVAVEYPLAEARFERNLAAFAGRVTKIKAYSSDTLAELGVKQQRFDVVYVDGDHRRIGAYRDCVLSWPLLKSGGLLLIDDYEFAPELADELRPKEGIDAFLNDLAGQFEELHRAYQIVIRKG